MPPRFVHRPLALASVVALGATAAIVGTTAVQASPAGSGNTLSSSNGSTSITFAGGAKLTLDTPQDDTITTMHGAAWAPDGSRAIFATERDEIATVRYNLGWDYAWMSPADGVQRRDPSYRGDGVGVLWAANRLASRGGLRCRPPRASARRIPSRLRTVGTTWPRTPARVASSSTRPRPTAEAYRPERRTSGSSTPIPTPDSRPS